MRRIFLGLAFLALACKAGSSSSQDVLLVTVKAPADLTGITHLNVTFTNAGTSETQSYPPNPTSTPIVFSTTLSATMPKSRTGNIDVSIDGLDAQNTVLAHGETSQDLVSGGQTNVTVTLAAVPVGSDAGVGGQGGATATGGSGGQGGAAGAGGAGGVQGGTTSANGGHSTATGGATGGGTAGIDAGVDGASGGSAGTSARAGNSGGGSSGTGAAGASGGAIVTGGVGAGGTGGTSGGTGGTGSCPPIMCPALACLGHTQPNPDPCGCPICAPNLDGGMAQDAGGSADRPSTDANSAETLATCSAPKSTGGIACPGGKCTVGDYSGFEFAFADQTDESSICLSPNSLCAAGTTGAQNPPTYSVWGASFGFNLSTATTATGTVPVQLSGTGVTIALSSLPTGADMRVLVTVGSTSYCAVMTAVTQTLLWTSFNQTCWAPTVAGALMGAPDATNIQFQVSSGPTVGTFDFCVTAISFQ